VYLASIALECDSNRQSVLNVDSTDRLPVHLSNHLQQFDEVAFEFQVGRSTRLFKRTQLIVTQSL